MVGIGLFEIQYHWLVRAIGNYRNYFLIALALQAYNIKYDKFYHIKRYYSLFVMMEITQKYG